MKINCRFSRIPSVVILTFALAFMFACAGVQPAVSEPVVVIDPPAGAKSSGITISGAGFQPNEEIDVVLILGPGQRVGLGTVKVDIISADENGAFSVGSTIPMNAQPGVYDIEVEGNKGSAVKVQLTVIP